MAPTYHERPAASIVQREFSFAFVAPLISSPTSREAARAIEPVAKDMQAKVPELLRERGARGATDQQIQEKLGLSGHNARARRRKLVLQALVIDSGRRRKTPARRNAFVWGHSDSAPRGGGA